MKKWLKIFSGYTPLAQIYTENIICEEQTLTYIFNLKIKIDEHWARKVESKEKFNSFFPTSLKLCEISYVLFY